MKTYYRPSLFIMILIILSACGGDEESDTNISNRFTFLGSTYSINDAVINDYALYGTETHDLYEVRITDGKFTAPSGVHYPNSEATFSFEFYLNVKTENDFIVTGTYPIEEYFSSTPSSYASQGINFSQGGDFSAYLEGEEIYEDEYYFSTGTITVSGQEPNYTISYAGTMINSSNQSEINVSGSFAASFRTILGD